MPASDCIPVVRAMIRWPPTCACMCAPPSMTSFPASRRCVARYSSSPKSMREPSCRASRTCRSRSRSRLAIILWLTTPRFGFVSLADRFCTGSSIMPQKKNPDVPELVRGKSGRVFGDLVTLLTLMKGQPLAYNKDNQEDKEPVFDIVDTLIPTLTIMTDVIAHGIEVDTDRMREAASEGFATATDLADYLVRKGVPFRDAHETVAQAVRHAEAQGNDLAALSLPTLQKFSALIEDDVYAVLTLEGSVASRHHPGGTAPEQVHAAIRAARNFLE